MNSYKVTFELVGMPKTIEVEAVNETAAIAAVAIENMRGMMNVEGKQLSLDTTADIFIDLVATGDMEITVERI